MSLCLLPNVGLLFSLNGMLKKEREVEGLDFSGLNDPLNGQQDELTLGLVWLMFWVDALIYWIILWYMDRVKPGPYGTALPPYFLFLVRV